LQRTRASRRADQFSERRETVGVTPEDGAYKDVGIENSFKQRLEFVLSLLDHPIDISSLGPARIARRRDPFRALVSQLSGSIIAVIMRSFGTPRRFVVKLDGGNR
jgi:hypothetical protein